MGYTKRELRFMELSRLIIRNVNLNYLTGDSDNILDNVLI